jgi:hypothetical protein
MSASPPVYYLNVSVRGYATEVLLNGAPICRTPVDGAYMAIPSVSEWMIAGENEIAVEIRELEPPTATPDPDSPRRVIVQLCVGGLGEMVEPGAERVLCELRHSPHDDLDPPAPRRLRQTYTLPYAPRWAWQDAPVFAEDDATDEELWTFLESLHADLEDGRIDAVIARERVKFAEVGPLYGSTPAEAAALTRSQFAELSGLASWSVAPIDRDEVALRRCCDGRVVELIHRDGRAALRSGPEMADVAAWSLYVFVARVRGLLEIIR